MFPARVTNPLDERSPGIDYGAQTCNSAGVAKHRIQTYREFWPFYLAQHRNVICRRLHFAGTTGALASGIGAYATHTILLAAAAPVLGYGMAWIGHAFFEKNRPATFTYPWWSLRADFEMYLRMWLGRKL